MNGSPIGFFESTPRILAASIKGAVARAENAHRAAAWLAWHSAALGRIKDMPELDKFIGPSSRQQPRQQPWQEQLAFAAQIVARAGG